MKEDLKEFCRDLVNVNRQLDKSWRRPVVGGRYLYQLEIVTNRKYDSHDVLIERDIREIEASTWWEAIHKIDPKLKRDDVIYLHKRRID